MVAESKQARIDKAAQEAKVRAQKHLRSLHHSLVRSDVMRHHHDGLIHEVMKENDLNAFNSTRKSRFSAYIAFWFTGLTGVIERYEELRDKGAIPRCVDLDRLITTEFKDIVKPFRNSVAHCSDHDDRRTMELFSHEKTVPDQAAEIAKAFHRYFSLHRKDNTTDP
ncbi:MAG TPA: hypothetical protein VN066_00445 [Rhodocyclaceae bacterium]|nr:hypothetical protein [Rhodocyclaceae bacterium]